MNQVCHAAGKQANIELYKEQHPDAYEENRKKYVASNKPRIIKSISASPKFLEVTTKHEFDYEVQKVQEEIADKFDECYGRVDEEED